MKVLKKLKERDCKGCGERFQPVRYFHVVCTPSCAIKLAIEKAEKKKKLEESKENKAWKVRKKKLRQNTKKLGEWKEELQVEVNHIVRLIDKGHECTSSGVQNYTVNAGHLYSIGAFPELRYNLLNIYCQSVHDNHFQSGNGVIYKERIKEVFGQEVSEEIESLKIRYKELRLSIPELKEAIRIARRCVRDLIKLNGDSEKPNSIKDRIELRRFYNSCIGIYKVIPSEVFE